MAHLRIARGGRQDLVLKLFKDRTNSVPTDDDDFVSGLISAAEWPEVKVFLGLVDHTAAWAVNLTSETVPAGALKGIPLSAGVYREAVGEYAFRMEPAIGETLGEYEIRVLYDVNGLPFTKTHAITLLESGSVIFGSGLVTIDDIRRGISTTLTDSQIEGLISEATDEITGWLIAGGIADPDTFFSGLGGVPALVHSAVIMRVRCLISLYDIGAGRRFKSIQEGSERITYDTGSSGMNYCEQADLLIARWLKQNAPGRQPMFGLVTKSVGHVVVDTAADFELRQLPQW